MKAMKLCIMAGLMSLSSLHAQEKHFLLSGQYAFAGPVGAFKNYVGITSPRGWTAEGTYMLNNQLGVGFSVGFNDFYEKTPRAVYYDKNTAVSAVRTNTLQTIPLLATVSYQWWQDKGWVKPYVSLGIGANNVNYEQYWGMFVDRKNGWGWSIRPLVGLHIPFSKTYAGAGVNLSAQYNYTHFSYNELNNIQSWQGNIGLYFLLK